MKVAGIVAEFNPFHTGHAYIIEKARRMTGCDYVIVVMSGNFVQRGEPAIADKFTRTRMALQCGADVVIELPAISASAAAADFARTAVSVLLHTGVVTHHVFGSESGQIQPLSQIADILYEEPESFKMMLRNYQRDGLSFPAARAQALKDYLKEAKQLTAMDQMQTSEHTLAASSASFLDTPNDILAVEYLLALKRFKSDSVTPVTISRVGAGYHELSMQTDFISASALRKWILEYEQTPMHKLPDKGIPDACQDIYRQWILQGTCIGPDDLTQMLGTALLQHTDYTDFLGISNDLSNRIGKYSHMLCTFDSFVDTIKTKNMTRTAISRALLHMILGYKKTDMDQLKSLGDAPYIRLLGLKAQSSALLKQIQAHSDIPVITKPAAARHQLNQTQLQIFNQDVYAARIYRLLQLSKMDKNADAAVLADEMQRTPVIC